MMRAGDRDTFSDLPVWFESGGRTLFGILTSPAASRRRLGVLLISVGGGSADRNDLNVLLAHRLGASGFSVFRFDFHGYGESSGGNVWLTFAKLFPEDVLAAVAELQRRGIEEVIIVGRCFGARSALAAFDRMPGLRGLVFVSMHIIAWQETLRNLMTPPHPRALLGLLDPGRRRANLRGMYYWMKAWAERPWPRSRNEASEAWLDGLVMRQMRKLVRSDVPFFMLYGSGDGDYREFRRAQHTEFARLLSAAGTRAQVDVLDGWLHHLWTLSIQHTAAERIQQWVERTAEAASRLPVQHDSRRPEMLRSAGASQT